MLSNTEAAAATKHMKCDENDRGIEFFCFIFISIRLNINSHNGRCRYKEVGGTCSRQAHPLGSRYLCPVGRGTTRQVPDGAL